MWSAALSATPLLFFFAPEAKKSGDATSPLSKKQTGPQSSGGPIN
jgi:hypothetical protein